MKDNSDFPLSPKFKAFMRYMGASVEFLEGTTASGKTTVGMVKFILQVARSKGQYSIIAGADTGTVERNILHKDHNVLEIFGDLLEYYPHGNGGLSSPHLLLHTTGGDKIIFIFGYADKARWKKVLGGQYECLYVDEWQTADIDFLREVSMRCRYIMGTMNPAPAELKQFTEFVNHARPLPEWADSVPPEIMKYLTEPAKDGWIYWFFTFDDNAAMTPERKQQIISSVSPGSPQYKNKILGLRGRASGLVFSNFSEANIISREKAVSLNYRCFSCGVDTAYSKKSDDTIALIFTGITENGECVILDEEVLNNRDLDNPVAPSDTARLIDSFMQRNTRRYGYCSTVFIDSADAATITEVRKYLQRTPKTYQVAGAYKKVKILDRIEYQLGWLHTGHYLVVSDCEEHIRELQTYSWLDDRAAPEDGHDHTINAAQYSWIPFIRLIGTGERNGVA